VAAPSVSPSPVSTEPVLGDEELNLGGEVPEESKNDKPFDDTPFDAGVEADEDEDPEKYIQQLAGKLGTTLRKYTEDNGEPDFELEKFAINSVISATHTAEMDNEDQKDIIKKIKSSGNDEKDVNVDVNVDTGGDTGEEEPKSDDEEIDMDTEENLDENDELFSTGDKGFAPKAEGQMFEYDDLLDEASLYGNDLELKNEEEINNENHELKNGMFFNDVYSIYQSSCDLLEMDDNTVDELLSNGHGWALDHIATANSQLESVYHYLDGVPGLSENEESNNYMFFQNLKSIKHASYEILNMDVYSIDEMLCEDNWVINLIARANDDVEEVYHFLMGTLDGYDGETEAGYEDEYGSVESPESDIAQLFVANGINEAEYKGRKVKLGKPTKGDVKKFKVYVKNKKGNVIKVNFGDPNMEIKRDNPERRKSFRARHKCAQAKDRTTPKYWSCKMWSKTPVSKMVAEDKIKGADGKACWKGHRYGGTENGKDICTKVKKKKVDESFDNSKKSTIFVENITDMVLNKLNDITDFGTDAPVKTPVLLPGTKTGKPTRKQRIWSPEPASNPKPKMNY
jgi:hypothetical protein